MSNSQSHTHRFARCGPAGCCPVQVQNADGHRRGGAVIIIVLALMAALAFIGFFFYEFSVFEKSASEAFAKVEVDIDPTAQFDDALEQLIVGTRDTHLDSALWGNKYSLLATLIGRIDPDGLIPEDLNPHSGGGVFVRFTDNNDVSGNPVPDGFPDDSDTVTDNIPDRLSFFYRRPDGPTPGTIVERHFDDFGGAAVSIPRFNLSRAASDSSVGNQDGIAGSTGAVGVDEVPDYRPDAGYTYPDINSMFLAYDSTYMQPTSGGAQPRRIFIPSFLRPQYLHDRRGGAGNFANLYTDDTPNEWSGESRGLVLRPHQQHRRFRADGTLNPDPTQRFRFLSVADFARSGDRSRVLSAFLFNNDRNGDGIFNGMGIFDPNGVATQWDLDVDCDNDGVDDAILMDLDLPIVNFEDGRQAVPLVAFKVIDADGLINLNAHGNMVGLERVSRIINLARIPEATASNRNPARQSSLDVWAPDRATRLFGSTIVGGQPNTIPMHHISASGLGRSPYEVNPAFGLSAFSPSFYQAQADLWRAEYDGVGDHLNDAFIGSTSQLPHSHLFGDLQRRDPAFPWDASTPSVFVAPLVQPSNADIQTELANMEFFMLLNGHAGGDGFQRVPGRHGEAAIPIDTTLVAGRNTRLQPVVNRNFPAASANSIVPGAGRSHTFDRSRWDFTAGAPNSPSNDPSFASDDDQDAIGIEVWIDDDLDGSSEGTDGDGLFVGPFAEGEHTDFDGDGTFDQQNAIANGLPHYPFKLGRGTRIPGNVHPTVSVAAADPFADRTVIDFTVPATDREKGRRLDLASGADGLANDTAARWPRYGESGRQWFRANYPSLNQELAARGAGALAATRASTPAGAFVVNSAQAYINVGGTLPYAAGAMGLTTQSNVFFDLLDLVNEEDEQIIGEEFASSTGDDLFDPSEIAALHLSDTDYRNTGSLSRVRALAPINYDLDPEAATVRQRFTTESNDRLEFHAAPSGIRTWEFNTWNIARQPAAWAGLYTDITPGVGIRFTFPPEFASSPVFTTGTGTATDPFREVLRVTLATSGEEELGAVGSGVANPLARANMFARDGQRRLAARKRLRFDRVIDRIDPLTGEPVYRDLVPHPDFSRAPFNAIGSALTIPAVSHISEQAPLSNFPLLPFEGGNTVDAAATRQEFWARQDRQNLARDIYSLVYTLCGPDGWNPTTTDPAGNPAAENHVRLAAQFAVNVVDAIDRDNVVTEFSYDPNLSDGWDASAPTDPTQSQSDGTGRISVYGVEAQQLSISEVLLARTQAVSGGLTETSWDDTASQQFAMIELRNASPFDVVLDDNSWRLEVVYDAPNGRENGTASPFTGRTLLDFQRDAANGVNTVAAGGNFIVGDSSDGTLGLTAATVAIGGVETAVLPTTAATAAIPPTLPLVDLDLAYPQNTHAGVTNGTGRVLVTGPLVVGATAATVMKADGIVGIPRDDGMGGQENDPSRINYVARLYRRRHLNDPNNTLSDNRWLMVDEMIHLSRAEDTDAGQNEVFDPTNTGATDVNAGASGGYSEGDLVNSWFSTERIEPLGGENGPIPGAVQDPDLASAAPNKARTAGSDPRTGIDRLNHTLSSDGTTSASTTGRRKKHWGNYDHTLPTDNPQTNVDRGEFTRWHAHFDRDLLSPSELLSFPLFGSPVRTNGDLNTAPGGAGSFEDLGEPLGTGVGPDQADGAEDLLARQLTEPSGRVAGRTGDSSGSGARPDPNILSALVESTDVAYENRWYRLFDFVEVPPAINGPLEMQDAITGRDRYKSRTPGRINLNSVRDEHVLAALLDEPAHLNPLDGLGSAASNAQRRDRSNDRLEPTGAARNWWREFLFSRDALDPFTDLPIPGMPGSRPFEPSNRTLDLPPALAAERATTRRGARYLVDQGGNFQDRSISTSDPDELGLFEARTTTDIGVDSIDPWTRNQLLAKVMNNGTERSNVFLVWVAIQFHEADHGWQAGGQPDLEDVRIGGVMDDMPVYRTFCVVDRSLLEQAYEDPDPTDGIPGTFDFRKFILHRQRLR